MSTAPAGVTPYRSGHSGWVTRWLSTGIPAAAAARGQFARHGYVATTIAAIADADIPAPTIYSAFGSKAKIQQLL